MFKDDYLRVGQNVFEHNDSANSVLELLTKLKEDQELSIIVDQSLKIITREYKRCLLC